ncbi:hypothetical protein ACFFP0_24870 [Rhizobium puerariae]|uniref:Restriction alleviation protein, Lar family n=1 Tax=Rhizobium puerariae TaxID=1585791 RepID=A0ABV6AN94_9HYPH
MKPRPYRCPGCDREAFVHVQRTTLHSFGKGGLVYSISCRRHDDESILKGGRLPNSCLGEWFSVRPFTTETNAISDWNNCIIEMAASALGITVKQALAIKEGRADLREEQ